MPYFKINRGIHQLVYRLQNHALDLPTPEHHSATLMVLAESNGLDKTLRINKRKKRQSLQPVTSPLLSRG